MLKTKERPLAVRTLRGWTISVLLEVGTIRPRVRRARLDAGPRRRSPTSMSVALRRLPPLRSYVN